MYMGVNVFTSLNPFSASSTKMREISKVQPTQRGAPDRTDTKPKEMELTDIPVGSTILQGVLNSLRIFGAG